MSSLINENQQWVDDGGNPIVNGSIYIGDPGLDPVLNPKSIFSDRDLTVPLANPVSIDSNGFAATKIFLSGRYSLQVDDASAVTLISELDNGEAEGTVTLTLDNVAGINTITADGVPTITSYDDNDRFLFEIVSENTADAVTLNIDGLGAKAVKRSFDLDIGKGRFKVGQKVQVVYNAGNDNFELINDNRSVILGNKGADIASAATVDLSAATGNQVDITGTTTITSLGTVIAGAIFHLTFDGALTLTHNATSLILPTAANITTKAGDTCIAESLGSGNWKVSNYQRATGENVLLASQAEAELGVEATKTMTAARTQQAINIQVHGEVFTSGGSYTVPVGVSRVRCIVIGGAGGGGGSPNQSGAVGGGGGGGGYIEGIVDVAPADTITVTVGAGGGGGAGGASSTGTSGGSSIINHSATNKLTASGGSGGTGGSTSTTGNRGASGTPSANAAALSIGWGGTQKASVTSNSQGGSHGGDIGEAFLGGVSGNPGAAGVNYGSGGGGGTQNAAGGAGKDGVVVIIPEINN